MPTTDYSLFTPGPLNTSMEAKSAMLTDMGSRDPAFIEIVGQTRQELLELAGLANDKNFTVVPMQGSGTFAIEAAIGTLLGKQSKLLVLVNGAYGKRMAHIARQLGIDTQTLESDETKPIDPGNVSDYLNQHPEISDVAVVHCETTTGVLNPLEMIGAVVHDAGCHHLVDAMSSFGGIDIDFQACHIDALVASANKCLEGTPGLGFVICDKQWLEQSANQSASVSLDLYAQWQGLESDGQFRFTPPTHIILALHHALAELRQEGGIPGRNLRYKKNHESLLSGMLKLGFKTAVERNSQSPIICTFLNPDHPNFDFDQFYRFLAERKLLIYPGKLSKTDCFRIGTIGKLGSDAIPRLLSAIEEYLTFTGIEL